MKTRIRLSFFVVTMLFQAIQGFALDFKLIQNHADGIYKKGETIRYYLISNENTNDSLLFIVRKNNKQILLKKTIVLRNDTTLLYSGKPDEPCSVFIEARISGQKLYTGSVVSPEKLKPGTKAPGNLKKYWENEKQALRDLKMEVSQKPEATGDPEFICFDTEINCSGPKPARGYFAKPVAAQKASLPIVLLVHAAGVKGDWCRSNAAETLRYARMGNGALCFDLNAHGMHNGQDEEYYADLEANELKNYFYTGLDNRDSVYFRGMYLRLIRTLDFLCAQPEWDGKRIVVIGESQGGGQALAAAGLDQRVSAVVATVPAMCDFGGTLIGRKGGWPQPFNQNFDPEKMKQALPYFDVAHLLKYAKAELLVEIGLVDQVCPPGSIYAAINQSKSKKTIFPVVYREHSWPTAAQRQAWDKDVFGPKNTFVENLLKPATRSQKQY